MITNKNKIALDLDEVTLNFTDPFLEFINTIRGTKFKREDVIYYEYEECGIIPRGKTHEYLKRFAQTSAHSHLSLMPGVEEAIDHFQSHGDLVFITSRVEEAHEGTLKNLRELNLGHIPLYFSTKLLPKWKLVKVLGMEVLIDDNPKYIDELAEHDDTCLRVLFSTIPSTYNCKFHIAMKSWTKI